MEKNIMRICADYIGDKVIICGREYPVGSLAVMLLDEGYRDDALLHITVFRTNIMEILDDL